MSRSLLALFATVLICCLPAVAVGSDDVAVERDDSAATGIAALEPLQAWRAGAGAVAAGGTVRRIAFARHGMFVFHSPADSTRIMATFFSWQDGAYRADETEARDDMQCAAPGVDPAQVAPALDRVLHSTLWEQHRARMDSLILECNGGEVSWILLPEPEGGYKEGVAIPTYEARFEP